MAYNSKSLENTKGLSVKHSASIQWGNKQQKKNEMGLHVLMKKIFEIYQQWKQSMCVSVELLSGAQLFSNPMDL